MKILLSFIFSLLMIVPSFSNNEERMESQYMAMMDMRILCIFDNERLTVMLVEATSNSGEHAFYTEYNNGNRTNISWVRRLVNNRMYRYINTVNGDMINVQLDYFQSNELMVTHHYSAIRYTRNNRAIIKQGTCIAVKFD